MSNEFQILKLNLEFKVPVIGEVYYLREIYYGDPPDHENGRYIPVAAKCISYTVETEYVADAAPETTIRYEFQWIADPKYVNHFSRSDIIFTTLEECQKYCDQLNTGVK